MTSRGVSRGWFVVGTCFVVLLVASGSRFAFGVVFDSLLREYDASRTAISLTGSIQLAAYALSQPLVGRLVDRYDGAYIFGTSIVLFSLGLLGSGFVTTLAGFYVTFGVLVGLGYSGVSALVITSIVSKWFDARRGLAVSVSNSGFNVGQLSIVPLLGFALGSIDWQFALVLLGVAMIATLVPTYVFLRSPPTDERANEESTARRTGAVDGQFNVGTLREAVRTRSFLGIVTGYFVCGFTDYVVVVHLVSYLTNIGIETGTAASSLGTVGAVSFVGVLAAGWVADRMRTKNTIAALYAFRIVAFVILAKLVSIGEFRIVFLYAFIVLFGLAFYATAPLTSTLCADLYGDELMGSVYGWASGIHQIGGALGAVVAGYVFDATGTYRAAFYVSAALVLVGTVASYLVREKRAGWSTTAPSG